MRREDPDRTGDHYPAGACGCGRHLAEAADPGAARSCQQDEVPAAPAERVRHDLHETRCACGREHAAPRPPGAPDAALPIGPRLRALAVCLVVFRHVPVGRCRDLIAGVAGADVPAGFIHSCLRQAAGLAAGVVRLIRALITAAAVAGFDETTLRSGPAGEKKYVHGAFTGEYSSFHPGTRSPETMRKAGILPDFAGVVVSGRYQNYFRQSREHFAGNQARCAHLLRDFQDCAETYPGAVWPAQAQRSLRGLIRAWHAAREQHLPAISPEVAGLDAGPDPVQAAGIDEFRRGAPAYAADPDTGEVSKTRSEWLTHLVDLGSGGTLGLAEGRTAAAEEALLAGHAGRLRYLAMDLSATYRSGAPAGVTLIADAFHLVQACQQENRRRVPQAGLPHRAPP